MRKLLGILVLGLLWCGTANATHTNTHYNKQFNITCSGETKTYASQSGFSKESHETFIQDIKVTIDIDNGKKNYWILQND